MYMGRDKFENEDMLKYGVENDIWFHVDALSSAHVYLRLQPGWTFDAIPEAVLTDCAQLVKYNSIEGNKKNNVSIVYTPFTNLKKEASHDVGQIAFHTPKLLKHINVEKRVNEIVNRLNKTKEEQTFDWMADKQRRMQEEKQRRKAFFDSKRAEDESVKKEREALNEARSYAQAFKQEKMTSNKLDKPVSAKQYEEDFF